MLWYLTLSAIDRYDFAAWDYLYSTGNPNTININCALLYVAVCHVDSFKYFNMF